MSRDQLLIDQHSLDQVAQHTHKKGVSGIDEILQEQLTYCEKQPVHIGIIGRSGVGKSCLINTLRDLGPEDVGAAKIGVTATTMDRTAYQHPKFTNLTFWDFPGFGTREYPRKTYIDCMQVKSYDAVIICISDRVTEDDIWITKKARESNVSCYFVRTNIDQDIHNDENDNPNHDEMNVIAKVRSDINIKLNTQDNDKIFILSTRLKHVTKWDFPRLIKYLIYKQNKKALIFAMVESSKDVIKLKRTQLMQRIPLVVCKIIEENNANQGDRLFSELDLYVQHFGLTEEAVGKHDVKPEDVKKLLKLLTESKWNYLRGIAMVGIGVASVVTGGAVAFGAVASAAAVAGSAATGAVVAGAAAVTGAGASVATRGLRMVLELSVSPVNVTLETAGQLSGVNDVDDVMTACKNILKGKIDLEKEPKKLEAIRKIAKILMDALDKYAQSAEDVLSKIKYDL